MWKVDSVRYRYLGEGGLCLRVGDPAEDIVHEEVVLENVGGEVLRITAGLVVLVPVLDLRQVSTEKGKGN